MGGCVALTFLGSLLEVPDFKRTTATAVCEAEEEQIQLFKKKEQPVCDLPRGGR